MARAGSNYTEFDDARIMRLKLAGHSAREIASQLNRTPNSVDRRIHELRSAGKLEWGRDRSGPPVPPPGVLEDALRAYAQPRSLTAEFFGDPLPGRSALDKRNG